VKPNEGSIDRDVYMTECRPEGKREYIVQLSDEDLSSPYFRNAKWVVLEKVYPAFGRDKKDGDQTRNRLRVKAWLHKLSKREADYFVEPNTVRIDQTLRVALGVLLKEQYDRAVEVGGKRELINEKNKVSIVPFSMKRSFRKWLVDLFSRIVGIQPKLMRVYASLYDDMEVPVCRIKRSVFDTLGIANGDFVEIASIEKVHPVERHAVVRALPLEDGDIAYRSGELGHSDKYPHVVEKLGLHLMKSKAESQADVRRKGEQTTSFKTASTYPDLPWILIDLDQRKKLDVHPGDVVRVYRSVKHLLWQRAYVMAIPVLLGVVSWAFSVERIDVIWQTLILGISLLVLVGIVVMQIRRKIA